MILHMTGYAGPRAQNTRTELATRWSESVTKCRDHFSQWGMGIGVGFFTETTGSLRNPGVQRSPSYSLCIYTIIPIG